MAKYLKIAFPQKCIGCELCALEAQRQLKKLGLEGSLIRIFRSKKDTSEFLIFSIEIDPRINNLNLNGVVDVCPTGVFEINEEEQGGLI